MSYIQLFSNIRITSMLKMKGYQWVNVILMFVEAFEMGCGL